MNLPSGVAKQSEIVVVFDVPKTAATLTLTIGNGGPVPGTPVHRYVSSSSNKNGGAK